MIIDHYVASQQTRTIFWLSLNINKKVFTVKNDFAKCVCFFPVAYKHSEGALKKCLGLFSVVHCQQNNCPTAELLRFDCFFVPSEMEG